jgi:hypothetical protein
MKKYIIGIIPEHKKGSLYMSLKSNLTELWTRRELPKGIFDIFEQFKSFSSKLSYFGAPYRDF